MYVCMNVHVVYVYIYKYILNLSWRGFRGLEYNV